MMKKVFGIAFAVMFCAALVPGLNAQTSLLTENFEGSFPPSGWETTVGSESPNQWFRNDYTEESNYTGGSGFCANNDDDYWGYQYVYQNSLESPEFDCTGYDAIWLAFNVCWQDYEGTEHAYVDLYFESPSYMHSWMEIWEVENTGYDTGRRDSIDLTPYLIYGGEGIRVRFRYNEDPAESGWAYWYQVDNVRVWGSTGGGPGLDSLDFQMAQIVRPKDVEEGGVAFNPACKVYLSAPEQQTNAADPTWPADVRCRITDLSNMQVVYDKTLTNYPFPEGYSTVSEFPTFTPEGGKNYKALFVVTGADDANPDNDNLERNWSTVVGEDVTPTEIIAPADSQVNAFKPSAKFLEKAGIAEDNVVLHYRIEGAVYYAVYEDSVTHSFTANEEYTAEFPKVAGLTNDNFTVRFWATNAKGVDISHPDLSKPFSFEGIAEKPVVLNNALAVSGNVVSYTLAKSTSVSLKVYDASGQVVATLASGSMNAGPHQATWSCGPGVYFVKLVTSEYSTVRKAMIIK